ncbi:uncharacterized protein LOC123560589 [Mercenaria mercenaria]|uniref:uncharacterized protein LOC123560589 n=1 Tax=Mercenaria mercenaria TaxID=6596 RepID=UPI001E1D234E|nr:uncharacterized protein LOC123560589 [Mercenaria mercenaria]
MADYSPYLENIWYDIKSPVSFSGPLTLFRYVKKEGKYSVSLKEIKQWLNDQDSYSVRKRVLRKFKRGRVVVNGIDSLWDVDLASCESLSKYNSGVRFLMVTVDVFSRYMWVVPLNDKTNKETVRGFDQILNSTNRRPITLRSDKGQEWKGQIFQAYLKKQGITYYSTESDNHANYSEVAIRFLKQAMYRYFASKHTFTFTDVLQDIVYNYNHRIHSGLNGMTPADVTKSKEDEARYFQYISRQKKQKSVSKSKLSMSYKFKVHDIVRISHLKHPFQREYNDRWTSEIFYISKRYKRQGIPVYKIKEYDNTPVLGSFYEQELQKVNKSRETKWQIDKIIKRRTVKGVKQSLVSWLGWPKKYNSWVDSKDISENE